jgi:hypothetical protein
MLAPDRALALLVAVPFVVGAAAAPAALSAPTAFTFADPEIVESSGLALVDGLVVTVNDSGDGGRVFAVDPASGETVGVTRWAGEPVDVEAVAPAGRGRVWVGDIGDNGADRDSVSVLRVPVVRGERTVEPESFELRYPDGATDAETLLAEPGTGRLVVVSKGIFGGVVYRAPARLDPDRPNRLVAVGSALAIATDGAFLPDGRHLVVRGYGSADVLTWPGLAEVGTFALPDQEQGEGLTVDADGRLLLSTEGVRTEVLRVALPPAVRRAVAPPPTPTPTGGSPATTPAAEPQPVEEDRPDWPWLAGGGAVLVAAGVTLLVGLRRRSGGY